LITLKNIISVLNQFQSNHAQIREILRGTPYDVDSSQSVDGVQMLWSLDNLTGVPENGVSYNLTAFFMEQVTEVNNPSNTESVMNECILICTDLINYLNAYDYAQFSDDKALNIELERNWLITPFEERFNSLYTGAFVNLTINSNYNYNRCVIPTNIEGVGYWQLENNFIIK